MNPHSPPPATRFSEKPSYDVLFPPLPRTLVEVSRLIATPQGDASLPALVRAIEYDPLTTTIVLRRVNSAYFGLRQRVSDLGHAVRLLGFRDVCELVMTSAISRIDLALNTPEQSAVFRSIMRLSVGAAFYARLIGQRMELEEQGLIYTVALMSNLGRLVLFYNRMQDYEALWLGNPASNPPEAHEERVIFGLDHRTLLEQATVVWQLPQEINELLRHLHHPGHMDNPRMRQAALAVHVAQRACQDLIYPPEASTSMTTSAALYALARSRGGDAETLRLVLSGQADQGRRFVEEMLRD